MLARQGASSIVEHLDTKLHALAADIIENAPGPVNMSIVMSVAGTPLHHVVLDRQLAALWVLEIQNPSWAVNAGVVKAIRTFSRAYQENPIENIPWLVVSNREQARHWIELRHPVKTVGPVSFDGIG
jgi:hypothetical protein